ncbi:hypothetical protein FO519_008885 [Halicephalobus sp. NKZ332]|nr:hypothetical protein FO519_008885 [Halicephalobus sp. NKZ332]
MNDMRLSCLVICSLVQAGLASCTTCSVGQITFTPGDLTQGTETPTSSGPDTDANGCLTLTLICPATNQGPIFMQFNTNEGGPSDPTGNEVDAVVNCVNGQWIYLPMSQTPRVITEVNCVASMNEELGMSTGVRSRKSQQVKDDILKNVDELNQSIDESKARLLTKRKVLGYIDWLIIFLVLGTLYGAVVYFDRQAPPVVPGNQHGKFSEERARIILNQITALGPRPSGSENLEVKAFNIINDKLNELQKVAGGVGANRVEIDIDRPTGCFDLKFLSSFTLCYHKITNIVARIGPKSGPTKHAVLLNCHFDTLPDTPGATDDAVSCAIMMEVLENLAYSKETLKNDIIFLFNGGRAFMNLEGTGAGGREILFQAGPGDSWLLKTYLDNAPHPHCSVMAQEVFQSGIIPSDTDFRIFRDYGRVSGLDIAYHRNGWLYHTEFDTVQFINQGAIQRAGDNVLAVVKALIKSPYFEQPAHFNEGNKWVFFDFVGLFTVFYNVDNGVLMNAAVVVFVIFIIQRRLSHGQYTIWDLGHAFFDHTVAFIVMLVAGLVIVAIVSALDLIMCWYSTPELVFPLYILPMMIAGLWVHSANAATKYSGIDAELFHYDSVLIIWAILLAAMTYAGLASSFYILLHVFFAVIRDPIIYLLGKIGVIRIVSPKKLLLVQFACLTPLMLFISYAVMLFFDFFVPVTGRLGDLINPEFIMMPLSLSVAATIVLFSNNLIYISRNMKYFLVCGIALFGVFILLLSTTSLGHPYKYDPESPRLRRLVTLHAKRTIYDFDGKVKSSSTGLFIQAFDYRGIEDLPDHTFLQTSHRPNCSGIKDEYCQLPYYTAIHELFPPEGSLWVPVPVGPTIIDSLSIELLERRLISSNVLNLTFSLRGGADKLSLHITPLNGYRLKNWSFKEFDRDTFGERNTYFVFMTYGKEAPVSREFWVLLENDNPAPSDPEKTPSLELGIATHYAHGPNQNSETLIQLRNLFNTRRKTPHHAIGFWKWATTPIGGNSEMIVKFF